MKLTDENGIEVDVPDKMFSYRVGELVQLALDYKNSADDGELARKWAIVRTELEKVHAYVLTLEAE